MQRLTVLYDPGCALCQQAYAWLKRQPQYVRLDFVPAGSELARRLYPDLDPEVTLRELTVIGEGGAVYLGVQGWLMCLWALRRYRSLALSWSTPGRLELARWLVVWVSRGRRNLFLVPSEGSC
jgi:predicted DCC family thiol-disulfide oxidoreductase YuxK